MTRKEQNLIKIRTYLQLAYSGIEKVCGEDHDNCPFNPTSEYSDYGECPKSLISNIIDRIPKQ